MSWCVRAWVWERGRALRGASGMISCADAHSAFSRAFGKSGCCWGTKTARCPIGELKSLLFSTLHPRPIDAWTRIGVAIYAAWRQRRLEGDKQTTGAQHSPGKSGPERLAVWRCELFWI